MKSPGCLIRLSTSQNRLYFVLLWYRVINYTYLHKHLAHGYFVSNTNYGLALWLSRINHTTLLQNIKTSRARKYTSTDQLHTGTQVTLPVVLIRSSLAPNTSLVSHITRTTLIWSVVVDKLRHLHCHGIGALARSVIRSTTIRPSLCLKMKQGCCSWQRHVRSKKDNSIQCKLIYSISLLPHALYTHVSWHDIQN